MEQNKTVNLTSQPKQQTYLNSFETNWAQAENFGAIDKAAIHAITQPNVHIGKFLDNGCKTVFQLKIGEQIANYVSMLPSGRGLSPQGIMAMTEAFCDLPEVRHLSMSELKTFFGLAFKRQFFGKLYGGFGYDTLMDWWNTYLDQRQEAIITYRENEHLRYKSQNRERGTNDTWGSNSIGELWDTKSDME